jgi:hypothetical protein
MSGGLRNTFAISAHHNQERSPFELGLQTFDSQRLLCTISILVPELYANLVNLSKASSVFRGTSYLLIRSDLFRILDDE